ncbi:hypothetical protein RIF29_38350 [Crotalaria pallida]|uniref:Uncharacterized protein n=1 Tax=Crotalaria pallida TaxID=3830 RepID=A0AAN9E234_CROPI
MSFPVMAALDVAALDVFTEEPVIPHLGAIEIAEAVLGALLEEAVNALMVATEDESVPVTPHLGEGLAIEIAEVVLGVEEAVIDIYL